jgi:hypothetical protein
MWHCYVAGEVVVDGTDFRNGAHFRFKADLFVPCGGRYVLKCSMLVFFTDVFWLRVVDPRRSISQM